MRAWWSKLRGALHRRSIEDDVSQEIDSHLEFLIDENIARGMTPEEAREAARRNFGNVSSTSERTREAWTFPAFESIVQDLRYGLRGMRRRPAFALTILLTLALGIGANTVIFSVVYNVLIRPLPYPGGERLVSLEEANAKANGFSVTWINFQHWRNENHTFDDMAAREFTQFTLTGRGDATLTRAGVVTGNFFSLLGVHPLLGRFFSAADDRYGAAPTVVLTHEFWAGKLAGDPGIVGTTLALTGKAYQVIGVAPPGLHFFSPPADFYVPMGLIHGNDVNRAKHGSIRVLGRLKPGVTLTTARDDLDAIMKRLALADPGPESDHRVAAQYLTDSIVGDVRSTLMIFMAAAALVLAIACANVASLLIVRSTARMREIAIRTAIGAGARRIGRQLLTENLLLATTGGALGLLLAWWSLRALVAAGPRGIPRLAEITLDLPVLLFAAGLTLLTGLVAGFAPVLTAAKTDLTVALKENSQSSTGARYTHFLRSAFVAAEIAITLVLVFASGLLLRSLITAQTANPGFAPGHVLALELSLSGAAYKTPESQAQFYERLEGDIRALPGVIDTGATMCPPAGGDCMDWFYSVIDKPVPAQGDVPVALFNYADPQYFKTLRIPLRAGRDFSDTDRRGGPPVAIVNEAFARQWWPRESAVGRRIKSGGPYMRGPVYQVVGVVGDVSREGLDEKPEPEIFLPFVQEPVSAMAVMIRTAGDPASLAPAVRRCVSSIDHNLPIQKLRTVETMLAASLDRRRFSTMLLTLFAALAMALAAVGIYGVLNYWVAVREDEIAIRLAIGAQRWTILRWSGAALLRLAAVGTVLGLAGGWAASHWLESQVYGVSARSPVMMAAAAGAVVLLAAIAAAAPLWRAMRVDAVRKLHHA